MGSIGILWSWKGFGESKMKKPFDKISQEHGGVKVGMRLKLKDGRKVEVKGIVHFPTKYIVQDENKKEFQVFTHEVMNDWMYRDIGNDVSYRYVKFISIN